MEDSQAEPYPSDPTDSSTKLICTVCKNLDPKNDPMFGHHQNNRGLNISPRIALLRLSGERGCEICTFLYDAIVAAVADLTEQLAEYCEKKVHILFDQGSPIWFHVYTTHGHITFEVYSPPGKNDTP